MEFWTVLAANDGTANDGTANDGTANDGTANDGAVNDGSLNDGAANDRGEQLALDCAAVAACLETLDPSNVSHGVREQ